MAAPVASVSPPCGSVSAVMNPAQVVHPAYFETAFRGLQLAVGKYSKSLGSPCTHWYVIIQ